MKTKHFYHYEWTGQYKDTHPSSFLRFNTKYQTLKSANRPAHKASTPLSSPQQSHWNLDFSLRLDLVTTDTFWVPRPYPPSGLCRLVPCAPVLELVCKEMMQSHPLPRGSSGSQTALPFSLLLYTEDSLPQVGINLGISAEHFIAGHNHALCLVITARNCLWRC